MYNRHSYLESIHCIFYGSLRILLNVHYIPWVRVQLARLEKEGCMVENEINTSIFLQKQDCGGERRSNEKEVGSAKKEERSKERQ